MLVGLVPMGGRAERWTPLVTPKELLPFGQQADGRPSLVVDQVLGSMVAAGVERLIVPITPEKAGMVMRYLGTRLRNGALICYVAAPGPTLVTNLVACYQLYADHDVLFGMPDTTFAPTDILLRCRNRLALDCDLVLGLFPSTEPAELDVVDHVLGRVTRVRPKPRSTSDAASDVWGVAAWGPAFSERLAAWTCENNEPLGAVFQTAIKAQSDRCALEFGTSYIDLGSYNRYRAALALMPMPEYTPIGTTCYDEVRP